MVYRLLADLVVLTHLAYLAFIVAGGFLAWRWPRLVPFHLAALLVGLVSITVGFDCPLTNLERWLRRRGGEQAYTSGFVDHYVKGRVYPAGHDGAVELLIGTLVLVAYVGLLTRHRGRSANVASSA